MKKKFKRSCTDKSEENRTLEQFPEWNEYFIYLETNGNLENIKRFVVIMQEYRKVYFTSKYSTYFIEMGREGYFSNANLFRSNF